MTQMNPAFWPKDEVERYLELTRTGREYKPMSAESSHSIVMGSTGPFAQYCGSRALKAGGNAVDAAVTVAIAQTVLAAGAWVSMAGIAGMVIFDPATGETHSVNGPYKTFKKETAPLTIPAEPTPSGRTALVPGFFASLYAAHQRFGALSWIEILKPSIWLAEEGIPVNDILLAAMARRKGALMRLPETSHIFFPNGVDVFKEGGWFKQPQLAETLRRVSEEGPDYIYKGEWASKFVDRVSAEGGKVDMSDMAEYRPMWSKPLRAKVYGHDVCSLAAPEFGGCVLIEGLRLLEALDVKDPILDGESLFWIAQVSLQTGGTPAGRQEERISDSEIAHLAAAMRKAGGAVPPSELRPGTHSDYVVTADAKGMMVAMCHSINTGMWGGSGLNIDGISIPDSACFQQAQMAAVNPGDYLPNATNPSIVFKGGEPVLVSSSIGSGLQQTTLQCVHAFIGLGLGVKDIVARTQLHGPALSLGDSVTSGAGSDGGDRLADLNKKYEEIGKRAAARTKNPIDSQMMFMLELAISIENSIDPNVLAEARQLGAKLEPVPIEDPLLMRGFWGAISRDPKTGRLVGARNSGASGQVIAQ